MGETYLQKLWAKAMDKLGSLASFVPHIAAQIKVKLAEGDVAKIRAYAVELREASEAQVALADKVLEMTEDGTIDLIEGSELALSVETLLDQYQDVATGTDEDKPAE